MDFEQALRAELATLPGLANKVFPQFATEGTKPPFIVYQKYRTDYVKTLDGTQFLRDGFYEFDILAPTYASLQQNYTSLVTLLQSFVGRNIGTNGPFVQNMRIEDVVENYERQMDWHRMNVEVKFYF
jgi:hypothetical protein